MSVVVGVFRCPSDRLKAGVGVVQKEKRERKESLRAAARRWRSAHLSSAGSAAQQSFKGPRPALDRLFFGFCLRLSPSKLQPGRRPAAQSPDRSPQRPSVFLSTCNNQLAFLFKTTII